MLSWDFPPAALSLTSPLLATGLHSRPPFFPVYSFSLIRRASNVRLGPLMMNSLQLFVSPWTEIVHLIPTKDGSSVPVDIQRWQVEHEKLIGVDWHDVYVSYNCFTGFRVIMNMIRLFLFIFVLVFLWFHYALDFVCYHIIFFQLFLYTSLLAGFVGELVKVCADSR